MRLDWAVLCRDIRIDSEGRFELVGLGMNGVLVGEADLPVEVTLPVVACIRAEPVDDEGGIGLLGYSVTDPDADVIAHDAAEIERWVGTAPQLVEPERFYLPMFVTFIATRPGMYLLRVWTDPDVPWVLPAVVAAIPTL